MQQTKQRINASAEQLNSLKPSKARIGRLKSPASIGAVSITSVSRRSITIPIGDSIVVHPKRQRTSVYESLVGFFPVGDFFSSISPSVSSYALVSKDQNAGLRKGSIGLDQAL